MADDAALRRFKSQVRSLLISAPLGVLKRSFRKEYMSLIGSEPPLRQLGYSSMDEFVQSNPDVLIEKIGPTGDPTYFVIATKDTQHVASLVARQKKPSLKKLRKATSFARPPSQPKHKPLANRKQIRPVHNKRYDVKPRPPLLPRPPFNIESSRIPPWQNDFEKVDNVFTCVSKLIASKERYHGKMIAVTGYPGHHDSIQQYSQEFRTLLFENFVRNRLESPVLNVFFTDRLWNVQKYSDPKTLPSNGGVKIKVWGILEYRYWKSKGSYCHSLKALYYKRLDHTPSLDKSLRITTSGGTRVVESLQNNVKFKQVPNQSLEEWLRKLIENSTSGSLFASHVEKLYGDTFHIKPVNFLQTVQQFPFINVEIVEGNTVLYKASEGPEPFPDVVILPIDKPIDVLVVSMFSSLHFYVQHISPSTTEALMKLEDNLGQHFGQTKDMATKLDINQLYAVYWEDNETWCRAKLLSFNNDDEVTVLYPDYGNQETVKTSQLRKLPKQFYRLPFQGVKCRLDGITITNDFGDDKFECIAFEKVCNCIVKNKNDDVYTVHLTCDDIDVNSTVQDILYPIESLSPVLPQVGDEPVVVILRDVGLEYIIVNIEGKGTNKLDELNILINDHHSKEETSSYIPEVGVVCCSLYDSDWYRVLVQAITDDDKAVIYFIDYGNTETVELSDIRPPLPHPFFKLPGQAISCKLKDLPPPQRVWNHQAMEWLYNYVDTRLLLQMATETHGILYTMENDNINDLMLNESPGLFPLSYSLSLSEYNNIASLGTTPTYVTVSHCVSPSQFTVQICQYIDELTKLQDSLQIYSKTAPSVPLYRSELLCIALSNDDHIWYRAVLLDTVSLRQDGDSLIEEVPVRYLDYGNEEMLSITNIRQLHHDYLQLPFQAIDVQLFGINLTTLDDSITQKFQQLSLDKCFFCQAKEVSPNGKKIVSLLDPTNNELLLTTLYNPLNVC